MPEPFDGTSRVFTGGIRTPLGGNARTPFIALELSTEGLRLRLRSGFLAWVIPDLYEEPYLWSQVSRAELAGSPFPGSRGVRFETDRAPFVFLELLRRAGFACPRTSSSARNRAVGETEKDPAAALEGSSVFDPPAG